MTGSKPAAKPRRKHLSTRAKWQRAFLAALAETSNVKLAASRAYVSVSQIYKVRRQDPDFARGWFAALCEGYENLEMELLCRLRADGTGAAGSRRDDTIALRLLTAHRTDAARGRALRDVDDEQAVLESIDRMIDTMCERHAASEALLLEDLSHRVPEEECDEGE